MKLSEINAGVGVPYDPLTDKMVGVRGEENEAIDRLILLPPITRSDAMKASGSDSTITPEVAAGIGAEATAGKANAGLITITTGSSAGLGLFFSVTYAEPFSTAASVLLMPGNEDSVSIASGLYVVSTSTGFEVYTTLEPDDDTEYKLNYLVVGF